MMSSVEIPIIICESSEDVLLKTQDILLDKEFENIFLVQDTQELLDFLDSASFTPLVIIGLSNKYSIPSLETTQIIKNVCPDAMIIGSGVNANNKCSISLLALQNGCDSWVEKLKNDYETDLVTKVQHWTRFITERGKLFELYNSVSVKS